MEAVNFTDYLREPFHYDFLSDEEKIVIDFIKKEKNIKGNLCDIYKMKEHFGNINNLHKNGLIIHYNTLKEYVITNNLIGLILYGANIDNYECLESNITINIYKTKDNNTIDLNIKNISIYLLKEYFNYYKENTVKELVNKFLAYKV